MYTVGSSNGSILALRCKQKNFKTKLYITKLTLIIYFSAAKCFLGHLSFDFTLDEFMKAQGTQVINFN